ncbi:MAG: hypothetical protein K6E10_06280 [Eubacterium sp.]|nr:hypothetical protein [Eubacterium sp.]
MKVDKGISTPMAIGVILQGIAMIIYLILFFAQKSITPTGINEEISGLVFPVEFMVVIIVMLFYVAVLLVMLTSDMGDRKTFSIIMLVVYAIIRIVSPYLIVISNVILSRKGEAQLVAVSTLSSTANMIIVPFTLVSGILVIVAIVKYGMSETNR